MKLRTSKSGASDARVWVGMALMVAGALVIGESSRDDTNRVTVSEPTVEPLRKNWRHRVIDAASSKQSWKLKVMLPLLAIVGTAAIWKFYLEGELNGLNLVSMAVAILVLIAQSVIIAAAPREVTKSRYVAAGVILTAAFAVILMDLYFITSSYFESRIPGTVRSMHQLSIVLVSVPVLMVFTDLLDRVHRPDSR